MKTAAPFRFDGHGINDANGQRICKVQSSEPYTYQTGLPERNPEFDQLSNLFSAAPELLDALRSMVQVWDGPRERAALGFAQAVNMARAAIAKAEKGTE